MSTYSIYFSPTQGTKKVTNALASAFEGYREIELCKADDGSTLPVFTEQDVCIIGAPAFGGRVPAFAIERIKKLEGNQARAVLAAVYGNRAYEDTLIELYDTLKDCGFRCIGAVAAIAEHSIMRQFAAGRPDEQDITELEEFSKELSEKLAGPKGGEEIQVPGNRPYKVFNGSPMKPFTTKACSNCGICVKACPAEAISSEAPYTTDPEKCFSCMRCIQVCPENAMQVNPDMVNGLVQKMQKMLEVPKKNELFI